MKDDIGWWVSELRSACNNLKWMRIWHLYHRWPPISEDFNLAWALSYISKIMIQNNANLLAMEPYAHFCSYFRDFLEWTDSDFYDASHPREDFEYGFYSGYAPSDATSSFEELPTSGIRGCRRYRASRFIPDGISCTVSAEGTLSQNEKYTETHVTFDFSSGQGYPVLLHLAPSNRCEDNSDRLCRAANLNTYNHRIYDIFSCTDRQFSISFQGAYERDTFRASLKALLLCLDEISSGSGPVNSEIPNDSRLVSLGYPSSQDFWMVEARYREYMADWVEDGVYTDPKTLWPEAFGK